jgi:sulfate transport system ATP-binding protein
MSIVLEHLTKRFAGHPVVNGVSLEVAPGELYVLLGPSGSGKSTLLRLIAGLSDLDAGRVLLHGQEVTDLPPAKRGVGFVFQSYALFRGMTVAENVEFALRIRGVGAAERRRRRDELLDLVGLTGLGGRTSRQLSGGQQQRVAIARALAHQPEVLLLDEPFGALDARVRLELRRTLRAIQQELGITTMFVTHDQEEAFELADRVGVMNFGRLLEEGPPRELYLHPETEFVATFLGTANLMVGECTAEGVRLGPVRFPLGTRAEPPAGSRRVQVLFRPEDVAVREAAEALTCPALGKGMIDNCVFVGSFERLRLRLPPLPGVRPISPPVPFGSQEILVEASRTQDQARRHPLRTGEEAWVGVRRVHALVHPGLRFLLLTDGSPAARAALAVGGALARLSNARVVVLAHGGSETELEERLRAAREQLGSGLAEIEARAVPQAMESAVAEEEARQPTDLVIAGRPPRDGVEIASRLLSVGAHHLLLVPEGADGGPTRVLICVAVGEPGKADVSFAGRLARHLGAEVTILTVLPDGSPQGAARAAHGSDSAHGARGSQGSDAAHGSHGSDAAHGSDSSHGSHGSHTAARAERFLASSARTLARQGVTAATRLRRGAALEQILAEQAEGQYDLLVLGAPLPGAYGRIVLTGLVGRLLREAEVPVLIVRSPEAVAA